MSTTEEKNPGRDDVVLEPNKATGHWNDPVS